MAKLKRRVAEFLERWVANLLERLLLRQLSGFESRHLSKIQNGRHKQRRGQYTLARQNNLKKYIEVLGILFRVYLATVDWVSMNYFYKYPRETLP